MLVEGWGSDSEISLPSKQGRFDTFWMSEAGIVDAFFFVVTGPKGVVSVL